METKIDNDSDRFADISADVSDKIEAIMDAIDLSDYDKKMIAMFICIDVVDLTADNHYEALGILEEAKNEYKERHKPTYVFPYTSGSKNN